MKIYLLGGTRVNNFKPGAVNKISGLWKSCNIEYPEIDDFVKYGVYHNYEKDFRGDYDLTIGTTELKTEDYISVDINDYKIYKAENLADLSNLWEEIWDDEENGKINRSYNYDFERYNLDGTIDIFIGVE